MKEKYIEFYSKINITYVFVTWLIIRFLFNFINDFTFILGVIFLLFLGLIDELFKESKFNRTSIILISLIVFLIIVLVV